MASLSSPFGVVTCPSASPPLWETVAVATWSCPSMIPDTTTLVHALRSDAPGPVVVDAPERIALALAIAAEARARQGDWGIVVPIGTATDRTLMHAAVSGLRPPARRFCFGICESPITRRNAVARCAAPKRPSFSGTRRSSPKPFSTRTVGAWTRRAKPGPMPSAGVDVRRAQPWLDTPTVPPAILQAEAS